MTQPLGMNRPQGPTRIRLGFWFTKSKSIKRRANEENTKSNRPGIETQARGTFGMMSRALETINPRNGQPTSTCRAAGAVPAGCRPVPEAENSPQKRPGNEARRMLLQSHTSILVTRRPASSPRKGSLVILIRFKIGRDLSPSCTTYDQTDRPRHEAATGGTCDESGPQ